MDDKFRLKIALKNKHGTHEFVYNTAQLNDMIRSLIQSSLAPQVVTPLRGQTSLVDNPITADRLTFVPDPNSKTDMILVIGARAFELQFRVPVADVFEILRRLENETDDQPNSAPH